VRQLALVREPRHEEIVADGHGLSRCLSALVFLNDLIQKAPTSPRSTGPWPVHSTCISLKEPVARVIPTTARGKL
jgi:hypothetical protein